MTKTWNSDERNSTQEAIEEILNTLNISSMIVPATAEAVQALLELIEAENKRVVERYQELQHEELAAEIVKTDRAARIDEQQHHVGGYRNLNCEACGEMIKQTHERLLELNKREEK